MRPKIDYLKKIRVAAVSYLNTKPLLFGIKNHEVFSEIELVEDYPANVAKQLMNNDVDVALVPVAVIPLLKQSFIITDYCIGCDGPVASVCLFSEVPIENVEVIYLDYQSRTSNELLKILLRDHWKKDVEFLHTKNEYQDKITGKTAGLLIGDRALEYRVKTKYLYDLGEAWKQHTGLPFVFAAWVANKELNPEFIHKFNDANAYGLRHLNEVIAENPNAEFDLKKYFTEYISYTLDEEKKRTIEIFLRRSALLP